MNLEELGRLVNQSVDSSRNEGGELNPAKRKNTYPFEQIKKRLTWILWIFLFVTILFVPRLLSHQKDDLITFLLYVVLSVESIIALIAVFQIRSIENTAGNVKQCLLHRIQGLQSIFRSYIFLNAFLYFVIAVILELSIKHHWNSNFNGYANIPLVIRFLIYLSFICFQYFFKKWSFQKNYGEELNSLIRILDQTREE